MNYTFLIREIKEETNQILKKNIELALWLYCWCSGFTDAETNLAVGKACVLNHGLPATSVLPSAVPVSMLARSKTRDGAEKLVGHLTFGVQLLSAGACALTTV